MSRIRYRKAIASCAVLAVFALLFTLVLTHAGGAKPRPAPSPGTVSGEIGRGAIAYGGYATAINIHNPSLRETLTLHKRAVEALEEDSEQLPPSAFQTVTLGPGHAVEVDCEDINGLINPQGTVGNFTTFTKGFVSVFATGQLDVVGVYSANPASTNVGITLEMLNITPRVFPLGTVPAAVLEPGRTFYEYSAKFLCGPTGGAIG